METRKIILLGNPQSTNRIYRFGRRGMYMTSAGVQQKQDWNWEAHQDWQQPPTKSKLHLDIELFFCDRRVRDIDNYSKICLDSMEHVVYENDSQIYELNIKKNYDKENPRIEITIYEL